MPATSVRLRATTAGGWPTLEATVDARSAAAVAGKPAPTRAAWRGRRRLPTDACPVSRLLQGRRRQLARVEEAAVIGILAAKALGQALAV